MSAVNPSLDRGAAARARRQLVGDWRKKTAPEPPEPAQNALAYTTPQTTYRNAFRAGYATACRDCAADLEKV